MTGPLEADSTDLFEAKNPHLSLGMKDHAASQPLLPASTTPVASADMVLHGSQIADEISKTSKAARSLATSPQSSQEARLRLGSVFNQTGDSRIEMAPSNDGSELHDLAKSRVLLSASPSVAAPRAPMDDAGKEFASRGVSNPISISSMVNSRFEKHWMRPCAACGSQYTGTFNYVDQADVDGPVENMAQKKPVNYSVQSLQNIKVQDDKRKRSSRQQGLSRRSASSDKPAPMKD